MQPAAGEHKIRPYIITVDHIQLDFWIITATPLSPAVGGRHGLQQYLAFIT